MADTVFSNGVTLTDSDWFNDTNRIVYTILADAANAADARTALAAAASGANADITSLTGLTTPLPGASLVLISTAVASASAAIDFTSGINSTYDEYLVTIAGLVPATNATNLMIRVTQDGGSTFKSDASDYASTGFGNNDGGAIVLQGSATAAAIIPASTLSTNANRSLSGEMRFWNPAGTTRWKTFAVDCNYQADAVFASKTVVTGTFILNTSAINGIRFLMSSGNIASGNFALYGIRKA